MVRRVSGEDSHHSFGDKAKEWPLALVTETSDSAEC